MTDRVHLLTSSRLRLWQSCPRAHHYRYEVGLQAVGPVPHALAFGTALHAGLEAWWLAIGEGDVGRALSSALGAAEASMEASQETVDPYDLARLTAMLAAYDARWQQWACSTEVLAVEVPFSYELTGPHGETSSTWRVAGKIDALVRLSDGRVAVVEHKSSSADAGAGSGYRRRLTLDAQVSTYFDGAASLGWSADLCLYDVLVKSASKPLLATPVESRKYRAKDGALYAGQRETDESPDEYRDRLINVIAGDPEKYLVHAEIVRTEQERESHRWALWHSARSITQTRKAAETARDVRAVPQHSHQCFAHGSPCQYLPICEGTASARDETKYRRLRVIHPELETTDTNENGSNGEG